MIDDSDNHDDYIPENDATIRLLRDDVGKAVESSRIKKKELITYLSGEAPPLDRQTVKYFVQMYYSMQKQRIIANRQAEVLAERGQPHALTNWLYRQSVILEKNVYDVLDYYTKNEAGWTGAWLRSIPGIGPVTAGGMIGYIDIENATVAGKIWSYAGLAVGQAHVRGVQSKFNPAFKTICWKVSQSFVYLGDREDNFYGQIIRERKAKEIALNDAGNFADQAKEQLKKNIKSENFKSTLEKGKLSPAHLQARAMRYGVKIFLSHLHEVMYFERYGILPPMPFVIAQLGHVDYLYPWNAHVVPGLLDALKNNHRDQAVRVSVGKPRRGEEVGEPTTNKRRT